MTIVPDTARTDLRQLELIDAYWRAANYLSVGQIYLLDNPLLTEPLRAEHVKPRLLGHWGTTPGSGDSPSDSTSAHPWMSASTSARVAA